MSLTPIEEALQRLVAATAAPPPPDMPVEQLITHADVIAKEREPIFAELSAALARGARLTDYARNMVDSLLRSDRAWRSRLDEARCRMEGAMAPTGRASAYRRVG